MCAAAAKRRDMLLTGVVTRERMFVDAGSCRISPAERVNGA